MTWLLFLGTASQLTGCEVWLDVNAPQCKDNKTCVGLLGRGYTCGPAGVCMRPASSAGNKADAAAAVAGDAQMMVKLPERWACLAQPRTTPVEPDRGRTVHIRFDSVDFTTLLPPTDLTADACNPSDIECVAPIIAGAKPDADGFFDFDLPFAFEGYFRLSAPNIVPAFSYTNRPFIEDLTFSGPSLVSPATLKDLSERSEVGVDTSLGFAIVEISDCDAQAGDGVHLENKAATDSTAFYFDGSLPTRDLQATTVSTTLGAARAPRAVGGFSNLKAGYVTFEATLLKTGTFVGKLTAQVRDGHITYMGIYAGY